MNNIYCFETIEECEKEIVNKSIILDMMHLTSMNLFKCFTRTIGVIMIWFIIISTSMVCYNKGFIPAIKLFSILLFIYMIGKTLISWVTFNNHKSYNNHKLMLITALVSQCKEFNETNYEEWQKKQMLKRFAALAFIDIE